jgi:L-alanine-DL-glutamate epimerase-like enolase superfamily enzyme
MKITEVKAVYPQYQHPLADWRVHLWQIVVRIETDVGQIGLGYGGGGRAAVEVVNGHFRELLIGRTVDSVETITAIWDDLYRASLPYGRRGIAIMALSGVDLALWDLLGRAENVPVYQLLGGKTKPRVRAYATGGDAEWYAELGFTAHKFSHRWTGDPADYDRAVDHAARARACFGPTAPLMVDCYMSWDVTVTLQIARRLAEFDLYWFEDVLTPDLLPEQSMLRLVLKPINLAGGEHEFTHYGFSEIAQLESLDIWQPDITWCGGITAGRRILDLARTAGIPVIPHRGGEVWGLHLIAASDCADLGEVLPGRRGVPQDQLWLDAPQPVTGYLTPHDTPGFGVRINEMLIG